MHYINLCILIHCCIKDDTIIKTYFLGEGEYQRIEIPKEQIEKAGIFCIVC